MGLQVTGLTQGKQPWEKEFIDFQFDGKYVSEFGMVAVNDGDRHSFDASPPFNDEVSSVNGVDGQYYWGTNFKSLKRSYSLATDGMTEAQVNAFKLHFKPGKYGKFIEDKLFHRYGYCRVAEVTTFNVVPFRKKITFLGREIIVNEYKGDCRITFEWDFPYLYATENFINKTINDKNYEEYLRAVYTNFEPLASSWKSSTKCIIGDETYSLANGYAVRNIKQNSAANFMFYNPSTAPTSSIITMTFQPTFTSTKPSTRAPAYFSEIADDINKVGGTKDYNTISITGSSPTNQNEDARQYIKNFTYSTPDVIHSINQAIKIAADYYTASPTGPALDLEEKLRLEIVNSDVMGWAASVLRIIENTGKGFYDSTTGNFTKQMVSIPITCLGGTGNMNANWFIYFNVFMLCMLGTTSSLTNYHLEDASWTGFSTYSIVFDSETCQTTMRYSYNKITGADTLEKIENAEKNCGDMVYSSYLKLDGGDTIDEQGAIASCHYMSFKKGDNSYKPVEVTLVYKYTYL